MDQSQYEQLVGHLGNPNIVVKAEALNIALQLTGTEESRLAMRKAGLTRQVLRCITDKLLAERAVSILINLAQEVDFADEVIQLNGIQRVIDSVKDYLIELSKITTGKTKAKQEENKSEETKTNEIDDEDRYLTIIQLEFLFLSNLSRSDEVKKQLLELHREPDFQGLNFQFMLTWFNHPKISFTLHFFGNILANLSSSKEMREFILQPKFKLLENITLSILSVDNNRRLGCLKTIRNCFFEYENEKTLEYLLTPQINVLNNLLRCLLFNIIRGLATNFDWEKDLQQSIEKALQNGLKLEDEDCIATMEQVLEEVELIVDSLLVVTNVDPEKTKFELDKDLLKFCLDKLRIFVKSESLRDRMDVISVCILKENPL